MTVEAAHIEQDVWDNPGRVGLTRLILRYDIKTDGYFLMARDRQIMITNREVCDDIRELLGEVKR